VAAQAGGDQQRVAAVPEARRPGPSSLLIVDDHASFRSAASALLSAGGWDVVGEAADGTEALDAVRRLHPDVVLLDVQLPGQDGFSVARSLSGMEPPPDVVLVSGRSPEDYAGEVSRAPVRGFIGKAELSASRLRSVLRRPA
jgi:DNA-binding NarL/FixJ family response regulator